MVHPSVFRVPSERERPVPLAPFFLRFLFDRIFRFLCGSFGLRGCGLVLICFRGTAPALRLFRLFGFFLRFLRSLRLLFRFFRFCRGRLFPAGSCRPFLDLLFLHNFSEVIDGNLRVLYLRFRLFSGSGETETFSGSFGGAGGVSLPGPLSVTGCSGVFVVLSSAISIYLLFFGMKKEAQLFSQAPVGSSSFLRHDTKIPPVVSFGRYFV